jgi:hypothetical protein
MNHKEASASANSRKKKIPSSDGYTEFSLLSDRVEKIEGVLKRIDIYSAILIGALFVTFICISIDYLKFNSERRDFFDDSRDNVVEFKTKLVVLEKDINSISLSLEKFKACLASGKYTACLD